VTIKVTEVIIVTANGEKVTPIS